jgi:DNA-binding CsgD family transcriptional regulator
VRTGHTHSDSCVLSDREAQVVRLLLSGFRVPLIARQLHLSPSTIRNQLSMVYRKLSVNSQQELILIFHGFWHDGRTPPTLLGGEVLRQPRPLCGACRTPPAAVTAGAPHQPVPRRVGRSRVGDLTVPWTTSPSPPATGNLDRFGVP